MPVRKRSVCRTILHDGPTSIEDAVARINSVDVTNYVDGPDEAQHFDCLDYLLTTKIRVDFLDGGAKDMTIGEISQEAAKREAALSYDTVLRRHGLTVRTALEGAPGGPWLVVSNRHRGLEDLFAGAAFVGRGWSQYLKRIPGARWPNHAMRFTGPAAKAVWIPITWADKENAAKE